MAVNLSPVGGVAGQFFDNNGVPLAGGKIYTYTAGTTTNQTTYTSASGATAHTNPIILDSGGRVPSGEIWLTDGLQYKFVIKTSTEVLIGTYDNIVGINSNFVNFLTETEVQTATAGQTVFTLTTMQYQPGTNNLTVYVDGVNQIDGSSYSYVETSSTVVTFTTGLHVGALVKFTTAQTLSTGVTDASLVTYDPPFINAVPTTVEDKLAQTVSVKDFGAVGDGVTDDTTAIQNAINGAFANGSNQIFVPDGTYKITSPLRLRPSVSIICEGSGLSQSNVTWDYTGTDCAFYSDEALGQVALSLGTITHANNTSAANSVDFIQFRRGLSASDVTVSLVAHTASNNGVILYGVNPATSTANNNQYRNNFRVATTGTSGAIEAPGIALWLYGQDVTNSRCNANNVVNGSRFDNWATCIYCTGNGNSFYSITVNGPASTTAMYFFGDQTFSNTVYSPYFDAGITGKTITIDNTSTVDRATVTIYGSIAEIEVANVDDVSAGAAKGTVLVQTQGRASSDYEGKQYFVYIRDGVAKTFVFDNFNCPTNRGLSLVANTFGGNTQHGYYSDVIYGTDATSAGNAFYAGASGSANATAYTTSAVANYRGGDFTKGTNQTVTTFAGFRQDDITAGTTNNYGFFSDVSSGSGKWNLYADGTAKNYFRGEVVQNLATSVTPDNNGEMMIQRTSNTQLTFKLKGTDGVVRSATLTLS